MDISKSDRLRTQVKIASRRFTVKRSSCVLEVSRGPIAPTWLLPGTCPQRRGPQPGTHGSRPLRPQPSIGSVVCGHKSGRLGAFLMSPPPLPPADATWSVVVAVAPFVEIGHFTHPQRGSVHHYC